MDILNGGELDKKAELLSLKSIIFFDLDGTLALSKMDLDDEMAELLHKLFGKKIVSVIGGGGFVQFKKQFLDRLMFSAEEELRNLFVQPTNGAKMYRIRNGEWSIEYNNTLFDAEKRKITEAFSKAYGDIGYIHPRKIHGDVLEDRESQITFSALGQKAPLEEKEKWKREENGLRLKLKAALEEYLPEFEVRVAGTTSVDVTKKGIDKAYGVGKLLEILDSRVDDAVYIGDSLFEGGNDHAVFKTGIDTIQVNHVDDTKHIVGKFLEANK